jgi:hypothetical protein
MIRECSSQYQGVAMPSMNALVSKWVPQGERSRSLSLIYSGMFMGERDTTTATVTINHCQ